MITTNALCRMVDKEGLILQGCGGNLQEWLDGINEMFTENGILKNGTKFQDISSFEYGGLTCLLYPFEGVDLNVGKLAMWRLQTHADFGGTWLSDFVTNRLGGFIADPALSEADPSSVPPIEPQRQESKEPASSARTKPKKQQER